MSVCLSQQLSGEDGCFFFARVDCRGASTARSAQGASLCLCSCDGEACWGSQGLLCVLLSVGGQSFVAPFFTACPLKDNNVFPPCLDVAVGRVGGHKRKYAAMLLQSSSRAGVKVSMLSLLLGALFLSLGGWCSGSRFSRDPEIHRWIRPASLKQLTVSRTVSFWWIAPSMPLCNTARHVPGCSAHQGQRRRWKGRKG